MQSQEFPLKSRVTFDVSAGPSPVDSEGEEEEEDNRDSVVSASLVLDKTFCRLIAFIYEQYPESPPLSPPSLPPRCGFENIFPVSDPPGSSRPRLRLYPWVGEIVEQTQDCSARLAWESKPLYWVLPS